jgi:hypothetical protein
MSPHANVAPEWPKRATVANHMAEECRTSVAGGHHPMRCVAELFRIQIKAAPAAPRPALPAPGSALGGPPGAPAPSHSQAAMTRLVMGSSRRYVLLALDCPDRGRRVQGGPADRRMRSAPPALGPPSTHLVLAPTRKTGTEQLIGAIQPPNLLSFQASAGTAIQTAGNHTDHG